MCAHCVHRACFPNLVGGSRNLGERGLVVVSVAEVQFSSGLTYLAQNVNVNVFAPGEHKRERELNGRSRSTAFGSRSESV